MRDPLLLPIDEVVVRLDRFDAIVDARSPSEFTEDHLPGALSAPVLALVGALRVGALPGAHDADFVEGAGHGYTTPSAISAA